MLANPTFGTLLSDSTLGTTFAQNARLNKLTTFSNDPMLDNLGERLFLRVNGKIFDVLRASCARFGDNRAEYVSSAAGIQVTVTVTVPRKGMRKQVEVLLENQNDAEKQADVCYYTRPVLGEDDRRAKNLQSRFFGGALEVHSPLTPAYPGTMRLFAEGENTFLRCMTTILPQADGTAAAICRRCSAVPQSARNSICRRAAKSGSNSF